MMLQMFVVVRNGELVLRAASSIATLRFQGIEDRTHACDERIFFHCWSLNIVG